MNFITIQEAETIIKKEIFQMPTVEKPLSEALHYYTAKPVYAPIDVPPFDNSAMDGYAFAYQDYVDKKEIKVRHTIQAGDTRLPILQLGEAARIFTGAMIPEGADTVVMQENTKEENGILHIEEPAFDKGQNIRPKGSQSKKGDLILPENILINPGTIGMLAGFGINKVDVFSFPKVGIIITGNELIEAGKPLKEGQIYESNAITLQSALREQGIEAQPPIRVQDDREATFQSIKKSLETADVLLITGGISVGEYDFVKESLEKSGVEELFYKVRQKPGKPLFFGKKKNRFVFALPGNPAPVLVCFYRYVLPFLEGLKGNPSPFENKIIARLSDDYNKKNELTNLLKGLLGRDGTVTVLPNQESYKMDAFVQANCLVEISGEKRKVVKNEKVIVWKI
ncbi:MAG: molybdopterin molybdotransferase MoeA [Candidatus Azobacteroides sp.]|nr:molybdopterin molybdotransferase MoeA [Candidatus Azobacteroides sp.]